LQHLTCLKHLVLHDTYVYDAYVTDAGLAELQRLPSLTQLELHKASAVTDAGLAALQHLPRLTHLKLTDCKLITDTWLAALKHVPALTHLALVLLNCDHNLTNGGLAGLHHMPALTSLRLCSGVEDDDADLLALGIAELRQLGDIDIEHEIVT